MKQNIIKDTLIEQMKMKLNGSLYHETQVLFAYNTNRIEGSQLTEEQTRYIFETKTIGLENNQALNVDDIIETHNHFKVFDYMLENVDNLLTEEMIKRYHEYIKRSTSFERIEWFAIGDYKKKANTVSSIKTVSPSQVSNEMKKLLQWYNNLVKTTLKEIVEFHYKFECIHPFQDGNGRVGRLIMFKECLKNDVDPFVIDDTQKLFYYRGLKEYNSEKGYLEETCGAAQDKYKLLCEYYLEDLDSITKSKIEKISALGSHNNNSIKVAEKDVNKKTLDNIKQGLDKHNNKPKNNKDIKNSIDKSKER